MADKSRSRKINRRVDTTIKRWLGELKTNVAGLGRWSDLQLAPALDRVPISRRRRR